MRHLIEAMATLKCTATSPVCKAGKDKDRHLKQGGYIDNGVMTHAV